MQAIDIKVIDQNRHLLWFTIYIVKRAVVEVKFQVLYSSSPRVVTILKGN